MKVAGPRIPPPQSESGKLLTLPINEELPLKGEGGRGRWQQEWQLSGRCLFRAQGQEMFNIPAFIALSQQA